MGPTGKRDGPATAAAGRGRRLLAAAVIIYAASIRLPDGKPAAEPDGSAHYAFNIASDHGLRFGRDIVHVAGPLGRFIYPVPGEGRLLQAHLFALGLHAVFLAVLNAFAAGTGRRGAAAGFLLVAAFFSFARSEDIREVQLLGIPLALALADLERPRPWTLAAAAMVPAVLSLAKFNLLVTLGLQAAVVAAAGPLAWKEPVRRAAARAALFALTLGLGALAGFGSPAAALRWLALGFEFAKGGSEALSLPGPASELVLAGLATLATAGIALSLGKPAGGLRAAGWLALAAVPLFFEYKHAFVRADRHVVLFFEFIPVAAATHLLVARRRSSIALLAAIAVIGMAGPAASQRFRPILPHRGLRFVTVPGLRDTLSLALGGEEARAAAARARRGQALTPAELAAIGPGTVDFPMGEVALLEGTGLRWRPAPIFQGVHVRSVLMDRANRDHVLGPGAADALVLTWGALDGRHPLHAAPETFLAILDRYRLAAASPERLVLRRDGGGRVERRPLSSTRARWDEPVPMPAPDRMVLASIRTRLTAAGAIRKALFRIPPVMLRLDDGAEYRFLAATAAGGILVGRLPRSLDQLRPLFEDGRIHPGTPRTTSFTLVSGDAAGDHEREFEVDFEEACISPR